jgi:hypothetical protein
MDMKHEEHILMLRRRLGQKGEQVIEGLRKEQIKALHNLTFDRG